MTRILGTDIPEKKKILYSLPYLYGVGLTSSRTILRTADVDPNKLTAELTADEVSRIQKVIERSYKVEGDLRKEVAQNIKRYKEIGAWRGLRHARRLPVHGRSKTNSRTTRGNIRKSMGSGRKQTAEKT